MTKAKTPANHPNTAESISASNAINDDVQHHQRIFEQRFDALMNGFGKTCEENNVVNAIVIAMHPDEKDPMVFIRGGEYDAARLLAFVLRNLKHSMNDELRTD